MENKSHNFCSFCGAKMKGYGSSKVFKQCTTCGMIFRDTQKEEILIDKLYEESWQKPEANIEKTGGTSLKLARIYTEYLLRDLRLNNFANKRILDFGAGRGSFSEALSEAGAEIFLFEPYGYDYLNSKGYKVFRDLAEIPESLKFDGIVSIDVMEHLEAPWSDLVKISLYVKEGGWIFLATPNSGSLNSIVNKHKWRELQNPSHLTMLNSKNFEVMLERVNLKEFKRLTWNIDYHQNGLRNIAIRVLRVFGLDGELRYLIRIP